MVLGVFGEKRERTKVQGLLTARTPCVTIDNEISEDICVDRVESGAGSTLKCRVLDKWSICEVENSVVKTRSGTLLPMKHPASNRTARTTTMSHEQTEHMKLGPGFDMVGISTVAN